MIPYFDEAFALSNEKTTADILKNFSSVSVLVSSTLADKNEIPNILNHFKEKHGIAKEDDTYLHYIKSTVQHINCEFISDSGDIIPPHYGIQDEAHFNKYLTNLLDTPILQRGYSHTGPHQENRHGLSIVALAALEAFEARWVSASKPQREPQRENQREAEAKREASEVR